MNREPLVTAATITGLIAAVIALIVAFGIDVSQEQTAAILGLAAIVAPLVVAATTRGKVTPVSDPVAADGTRLVSNGLRVK